MDALLYCGAIVLLGMVKRSVEEQTRRNDEAHKRAIAESVYGEFMRARARNDARVRERYAAIERLRFASSDPRWQQRINQMLATVADG